MASKITVSGRLQDLRNLTRKKALEREINCTKTTEPRRQECIKELESFVKLCNIKTNAEKKEIEIMKKLMEASFTLPWRTTSYKLKVKKVSEYLDLQGDKIDTDYRKFVLDELQNNNIKPMHIDQDEETGAINKIYGIIKNPEDNTYSLMTSSEVRKLKKKIENDS